VATILVALAIFIPISAQTITTFDAPGAGTGPGQVWSIAPNGAVTGFFFDPNNVVHGFAREADAGASGLPKFYRTVTPGRPMPLHKRHSLPEIIAHERLRSALTPVEV
jgi:hypothetical protein